MIYDLMSHLVSWIYQHPHWAGLVLFLLSAAESMTVVGSFIPGTIVMTAVGIFIGANLLPYWPMVIWAATGALLGDALNFTAGYFLKDNISHVWPFRTRKHWLIKGQQFFEKHGKKSIFFARFIGPLRAFAPIIFGAMRVPASKFYFMDSLSALFWAMTYLLPGILLGEASLELSPDISEHLFRFVFLALITIIAGIWIIRLLVLHINDVVKNALSCLWTQMKESPSFSFFCYLFRHHKIDHPRGQLGTLFVFLLLCVVFICLIFAVCTNNMSLITYNNQVYHGIETLRMHWLDKLMLFITILGEKKVIAFSFLTVLGWLCYQRKWRATFFWVGAFLLGVGGAHCLKDIIHFHRPNLAYEVIDGLSFPSGHAVLATVFYGGFAYLAAGQHTIKFRWLGYSLAIILIVAVMCSRLFLGVHWLSDIIGGVLFGWICLVFMALFYQRYPLQNIQALKVLPFLIMLQLGVSSIYVHHNYTKLLNNYFPSPHIQSINIHTWWQEGYPAAATIATNRIGTPRSLLNIQWAGHEKTIVSLLEAQGWHSALEPHNWVLEIQHPEERTPHINLHLKTQFFEDQKPKFIFYKPINLPHAFIVLQLWDTDIRLEPSALEIYVGALSFNSDIEPSPINFGDIRLTAEFLQSLNNTVKTHVVATQTILPSQSALNDTPVILIQPN